MSYALHCHSDETDETVEVDHSLYGAPVHVLSAVEAMTLIQKS